MPRTTKSPRTPSRIPRTPFIATVPRPPKRVTQASQLSQPSQHLAKRITTTPQFRDIALTPRRAVPNTPRSILRTASKPTLGSPKDRRLKTSESRLIADKLELQIPDVNGDNIVRKRSSKMSTLNGRNDTDTNTASPEITINQAMSETKLQLLNSSPLNRLISEQDRKAAAAEVAVQKVSSTRKDYTNSRGLGSKDQFVPFDTSTKDRKKEDPIEIAKLERAKKKETRKLKWKARPLHMRGGLPDISDPLSKTGVVYLGHIPHGFYEKEMRSYFSQFGEVTRVRLSRSKKTARSRGFAFLEFAEPEVASVAAKAMDGYLMHGQALVAKFVPDEKVHPDTFKGSDRTFKKVPWSSIERRKMITRAADPLKLASRSRRVKKLRKDKVQSLLKKGIKYEFPEIHT